MLHNQKREPSDDKCSRVVCGKWIILRLLCDNISQRPSDLFIHWDDMFAVEGTLSKMFFLFFFLPLLSYRVYSKGKYIFKAMYCLTTFKVNRHSHKNLLLQCMNPFTNGLLPMKVSNSFYTMFWIVDIFTCTKLI